MTDGGIDSNRIRVLGRRERSLTSLPRTRSLHIMFSERILRSQRTIGGSAL
ncbi:hypothetical protein GCM10007921_38890 [Tritonibacter mobilis]|nr:hypothetical protein GCM10007921_38890 [Tritonibacter mobilis]